jgi:ABC-type Zn uptake system ZnuABC Zn-binding protein ZnuA
MNTKRKITCKEVNEYKDQFKKDLKKLSEKVNDPTIPHSFDVILLHDNFPYFYAASETHPHYLKVKSIFNQIYPDF